MENELQMTADAAFTLKNIIYPLLLGVIMLGFQCWVNWTHSRDIEKLKNSLTIDAQKEIERFRMLQEKRFILIENLNEYSFDLKRMLEHNQVYTVLHNSVLQKGDIEYIKNACNLVNSKLAEYIGLIEKSRIYFENKSIFLAKSAFDTLYDINQDIDELSRKPNEEKQAALQKKIMDDIQKLNAPDSGQLSELITHLKEKYLK